MWEAQDRMPKRPRAGCVRGPGQDAQEARDRMPKRPRAGCPRGPGLANSVYLYTDVKKMPKRPSAGSGNSLYCCTCTYDCTPDAAMRILFVCTTHITTTRIHHVHRYNDTHYTPTLHCTTLHTTLRRVSRGGGGGGRAPLEIEKQKKMSSEQILSYFTFILLLFLVENITFSAIFWAGSPPLKNWKAKKKKGFQLFAPPPYVILDTRLTLYADVQVYWYMYKSDPITVIISYITLQSLQTSRNVFTTLSL